MPSTIRSNAQLLRKVIDNFLEERLVSKIEKLPPDDPKYQTLVEQFQFDTWINDAARRVGQLQVVTHSLKPIHPDAKGSNLYAPPESLNEHFLVGSHALPADFSGDVVGNAAALDVYKFLKLEYDGKSLLERVLENDTELAKALSDNPEQAQVWIEAFAAITEPRGEHASHTRGKQLYWLVGDDAADVENDAENFHLLAPLYATSLAHRVFQTINHDRFSEEAKESRKAKREGRYAGQPVHSYPNLAVQKMGGTKPQNISQLNSERGGNNYLLASMPPSWEKQKVSPPYNVDSIFQRFEKLSSVKKSLSNLTWFLSSDPSPNVHTRSRVDNIHGSLIDELMVFTSQFHELPAGWSTNEKCKLPIEEIYWLDPERAEDDEQFRQGRKNIDWAATVRQRFSNWLNEKLSKKLSVGDVEFLHWQKKLKEDATHQRVLDRDRRWMASLETELDAWQGALDDE